MDLSLGPKRLLMAWHAKLSAKGDAKSRKSEIAGAAITQSTSESTSESLAKDAFLDAQVQPYIDASDLLDTHDSDRPTIAGGKKVLIIPDFVIFSRGSFEDEERQLATDGLATSCLKTSKATSGPLNHRVQPVTNDPNNY